MKGRFSAVLVSLSIFAALSMLITVLGKGATKPAMRGLSSSPSPKSLLMEIDRHALYAPEPRLPGLTVRARHLLLKAAMALSVLGLGAIIIATPGDGSSGPAQQSPEGAVHGPTVTRPTPRPTPRRTASPTASPAPSPTEAP